MREILFRGKRIDNGAWVEGGLISVNDCEHGTVTAIIPHNCEAYRFNISGEYVIPETIGQYTGLTDKNGKKIFEGDIIFCNSTYVNEMYYILFENLSFCYGELNNKYSTPIDDAEFGLYVSGCKLIGYEVIGNIHDNPELLKGSEEE